MGATRLSGRAILWRVAYFPQDRPWILAEQTLSAAESARRAWARGVRAAVLPTVPFGVNTTQLDLPLTLNLNLTIQLAALDPGDLYTP